MEYATWGLCPHTPEVFGAIGVHRGWAGGGKVAIVYGTIAKAERNLCSGDRPAVTGKSLRCKNRVRGKRNPHGRRAQRFSTYPRLCWRVAPQHCPLPVHRVIPKIRRSAILLKHRPPCGRSVDMRLRSAGNWPAIWEVCMDPLPDDATTQHVHRSIVLRNRRGWPQLSAHVLKMSLGFDGFPLVANRPAIAQARGPSAYATRPSAPVITHSRLALSYPAYG